MRLDRGHGSPYDRGSTDSYYQRPFRPHYFVGGSYTSKEVSRVEMTAAEILEYTRGFNNTLNFTDFKDWG